MFSLKLARHMGSDPALMPPKPPLQAFYNDVMDRIEAGTLKVWAILRGDEYVGHTILDKTNGEWELGTVLADDSLWGSGIGVRSSLHALKWAFEIDGANWVMAFVNSRDPRVKDIVERGGFKPFMHFWLMTRETWDAKWRRRMK